jgi:hypothetical protein
MDSASTPAVTSPAGRRPPVDGLWGRDGFGFDDLLDVVNPLQHLPGIGQLYRHLTGDDIGVLPQIAGGLLFGGPLGAAASMVSAGIEAGTGKTPAAHALAALQEDASAPPAPPGRVARAYAPPPPPTPHAVAPAPPAPAAGAPAEPASAVLDPRLSGTAARLLAELERSATTTG